MANNEFSSFRTTGIWVLLRYLALPIMIAVGFYTFGGPTERAKIHYRLYAAIQPVHEAYLNITRQSELLQSRIHVRDPDLEGAATVNLSDLPVAAEVPVVNLSDLPELDGPGRVNLGDLPQPEDDTVYFLLTQPENDIAPEEIKVSPRPHGRPVATEEAPPVISGR